MSTPVSLPVIPAQPNLEIYGFQSLALFATFTRDSYRQAFGVEAPAWDPSRLKKTWFDSSVDASSPSNLASYKFFAIDTGGNWTLQPMVMPAREAASVNLPGAVQYPVYVIPPSSASRAGSVINPIYLSLEQDARALLNTLGGTGLLDEGVTQMFPIVYPPDEPRRVWDILFKGVPTNVGALLLNRNLNGVGSPGHWDTSGSDPLWIPAPLAPTGLDDLRTPRPIPARDLLPNEKIQAGLMGATIVRTDLEQQANAARGLFTSDDRATLQQIYQILSRQT